MVFWGVLHPLTKVKKTNKYVAKKTNTIYHCDYIDLQSSTLWKFNMAIENGRRNR